MNNEANKIGILASTSYVIGMIIGSGIFITPGAIVGRTHSIGLSFIVWILGACISFIGALVYIELGTSIPERGGDFAYMIFAGWYPVAFAFMLVSVLLLNPGGIAVTSLTFGEYTVKAIAPIYDVGDEWHVFTVRAIAIAVTIILAAVNFYSLERIAAKVQVVVTAAKIAAVLLIIISGLYLLIVQGWTKNFARPFDNSNWNAGDISLAIYGVLWAYGGWDTLNYSVTEVRNPRRTLPIAILVGLLSVCLLYVAVNVSFFTVITAEEMANSNAIGALFASKVFGRFSYILPFLVAILLLGNMNAAIFVGSRIYQAAGREGHMPHFFSGLHPENGSPRPAVLILAVLSILMTVIDVRVLIKYVIFVTWGHRAITCLCLLYIKWKKLKVSEDAIRMPLPLTILLLIIATCLVSFPIVQDIWTCLIGFSVVTIGGLFYFVCIRPKSSPKALQSANNFISRVSSKTLNVELDLKEPEHHMKKDKEKKDPRVQTIIVNDKDD